MDDTTKKENMLRLSDAYLAGYIGHAEYARRQAAVHRAYYETKYGAFDLSDIPS